MPATVRILTFLTLIGLAACQSEQESAVVQTPIAAPETATQTAVEETRDAHSFANADSVRIRHLDLDLDVDFDQRTLSGAVTLDLNRIDPGVDKLVLDTRELHVETVTDSVGKPLDFQLGDQIADLGRSLTIGLPMGIDQVRIDYRSSPQASGLQWLDPVQTAGKKQPFLFSQSQAIHARTWIPLQDTPRVRFTYSATIRTPASLRAVMSADNDPSAAMDGEFEFEMPQAIPSYLMALAVGDLAFQPMSDRTGVYAEPSILASAAREFEDTEAMMQRCETMFGPYRWGRYDLLILPPSFPFGGMENPRLSFITPTVIAGDKSLVALIAHELAHSWSGNLVTNASWNDLWLNEGFTVYLEARIMEAVFGEDRRSMEDVLGYQSLMRELQTTEPDHQHLYVSLANPDDAFSDVPYEKGRLMLVWLEHRFGREVFDQFLRGYFDTYGFRSMSTPEFLAYLDDELLAGSDAVSMDEVKAWVYGPGVPENAVLPESDAFERVDTQRKMWLEGERAAVDLDTAAWSVHEWLNFLNNLPVALSDEQLDELDQAFGLTTTGNAEIAHSWLLLAIHNRYQPAFDRLDDYLVGIGRRKLIEPLYVALTKQEWGLTLGREIYARARPGYHPQAAAALDRLLAE